MFLIYEFTFTLESGSVALNRNWLVVLIYSMSDVTPLTFLNYLFSPQRALVGVGDTRSAHVINKTIIITEKKSAKNIEDITGY